MRKSHCPRPQGCRSAGSMGATSASSDTRTCSSNALPVGGQPSLASEANCHGHGAGMSAMRWSADLPVRLLTGGKRPIPARQASPKLSDAQRWLPKFRFHEAAVRDLTHAATEGHSAGTWSRSAIWPRPTVHLCKMVGGNRPSLCENSVIAWPSAKATLQNAPGSTIGIAGAVTPENARRPSFHTASVGLRRPRRRTHRRKADPQVERPDSRRPRLAVHGPVAARHRRNDRSFANVS
jgi:hypothetical protein